MDVMQSSQSSRKTVSGPRPRSAAIGHRRLRFLVGAHCLLLAVSLAHAEDDVYPFPFRALRVEGGSIWVQSGVTRDPETPVPPLAFGKMRYPARYFLVFKNESNASVWLDVEWRFPDDKPKTIETGEVRPGRFHNVWRRKFGLICDEPIPVQIRIHTDAKRDNSRVQSHNASLLFPCSLKEPFLRQFATSSASMILPGWPEMSKSPGEVPGSAASVELQERIQYSIWREESQDYPDCVHQAVRAEVYEPPRSATLMKMTDAARQRAEMARARNALRFEKWLVNSCEQASSYEVLIFQSPEGKTEFRVEQIAAAGLEADTSPSPSTREPAAAASPPAPAPQPEPPPGLFDGRGWRVGYEAKQPHQEITEYVLPGETVGNWTELLSIQVFPGALARFTPEQLMLESKKKTFERCPKTVWSATRQIPEEVLFEWQTEKCRGLDDEYELELILASGQDLRHISYASRKLPVSESQRAQWRGIIEKLAVSGSPP